jgi:hypothetical protein
MPKHDVKVQLSDLDGNVFAVIGAVAQALRKAGLCEQAAAFKREALSCHTYTEVLQ